MKPPYDRESLDTSRVLRTIAKMLRGLDIRDPATSIEIHNIARRLDHISDERSGAGNPLSVE